MWQDTLRNSSVARHGGREHLSSSDGFWQPRWATLGDAGLRWALLGGGSGTPTDVSTSSVTIASVNLCSLDPITLYTGGARKYHNAKVRKSILLVSARNRLELPETESAPPWQGPCPAKQEHLLRCPQLPLCWHPASASLCQPQGLEVG